MTTENEARDYHGRWTASGVGDSDAHAHPAGPYMAIKDKTQAEKADTHDELPIVQPPFELRRKSRREQTPHNAAVQGFAVAIGEAEKHRQTLKRRFGYTDQQIGTMATNYNLRKRTP